VLLSAQPKYLEAAFEEIDRAHGSFDAYLEQALAVDETQRERLVETLTELLISSSALDPDIGEIRST
jgi:protein-tyrosine phosphatase